MSEHIATFTWGAGPQTVFVAGGFNNWSDHASPLEKQPDGAFVGKVKMPWGEKQAFKYVVDGEWKVREDEAKEWDAAGNMNNVYTAPAAPVAAAAPVEHHEPAPAAAAAAPVAAVAAVPVAGSTTTKSIAKPSSEIPALGAYTSSPSTATTTTTTTAKTEPSTLLASSAPGAASTGTAVPVTTTTTTSTSEPLPDQIEKIAATSNVGEAPVAPVEQPEGILERAAEMGGAAVAAVAAAATSAAIAVEKATGVDLTGTSPLTVEEAKAKGINVDGLEKKEAPTDAVSPVGTKPPASAGDALEEKISELQRDAPVTAKVDNKPNDIPAQHETKEANHQKIPIPVITAVSGPDPAKDRTLASTNIGDSVGAKPVSENPDVDLKKAKNDAETKPLNTTGSTPAAASGAATTTTTAAGVLPAGQAYAASDTKSKNFDTPEPATKKIDTTPAPAAVVADHSGPATPAKDVPPKDVHPAAASPAVVEPTTPAAAAPSTPAKTHPAATSPAVNGTPASARTETTTSSPAPKGSEKASDTKMKKKSSFFGKIKHAFSPKDKEKK